MTPAEFAREVDRFVARLGKQGAIAILQYGSSLRPQDFVPGQSDLDLIVISNEPLRDVENALGYRYTFISPRDFIAGVAAGDMFWLSALQSGKVRFDPRGFFHNLSALRESGLDLRPNLQTLRSCAALTGHQLEAAMNLYFSGTDPSPARALRLLYSAAKGVGGYCAIASTGVDPHGYDGIVNSLERFPEVASLMRRCRERMLAPDPAPHDLRPRARVEDDALGSLILEVERCALREVALLPGRQLTNELIDEYQSRHDEDLERTLVVRMDATRASHTVIGETGGGGYCLFGLADTRLPRATFFSERFEDQGALQAALGPIALPR